MDNLTAIIISFLRTDYTIDCIKSLRKTYPNIKILVGEQVRNKATEILYKTCEKNNAQYIKLPWDCGVGKSRNILIKEAKTDYILVGDDDFIYDENAKVDKMLTFIQNSDVDLIGGRILENGKVRNYQGFIEIGINFIKTTPIIEPDNNGIIDINSGLRVLKCDLTFNFFVIKKETAQECQWDENIKVAYEHHHFFIGLKKAGKKVAFSPDPIVKHKFQNYPLTNEYRNYRLRRQDKEYYFKSLGIDYALCINGAKDTL
jgi:GT2 family glycosyltransferase